MEQDIKQIAITVTKRIKKGLSFEEFCSQLDQQMFTTIEQEYDGDERESLHDSIDMVDKQEFFSEYY